MQALRPSRATTSHRLEGFGIHVLNAPFDGTHPATESIAVSGNTLREREFTGVAAEADVRVTLSDDTLGRALGRQDLTEGVEHNRGALGTIANNRVEAKQNPPGGNTDIGIPATTLLGQGSPVDIQGRDPDALGRNRVDDSSCAAP